MRYLSIFFFVITAMLTSCSSNTDTAKVEELYKTLKFDNNKIEYMGRIGETDSTSELYWSGSSIKVEFEGTEISATLQDEKGDNYFNIIIDNDSIYTLRLSENKATYQLADNLSEGKHTVQIFKRTEWPKGKTSFYGFTFVNETKVKSIEKKKIAIEFYGNSITSGYAVEDYSGGDSPDSVYTNSYNSYASVTARYFDADYTCISRGGIGVMVSWYPLIMPEMYYRLNPDDADSKWDFTKSNPDIVVINLFQNDSWIVENPDNEQFISRFGKEKPTEKFIEKSYADFVKTIRAKYPNTNIVCMLGNMDITQEGSPWPGYVKEAVASLNDDKVSTVFVPYKNTPGHPKVEEQQIMADSLISYIKKHINN
ncbi:MAG: electron transporter RnfD [Flavobacteriales bacterium]|nr:electron transporter RnfD [Flavobacteriales bacterium]